MHSHLTPAGLLFKSLTSHLFGLAVLIGLDDILALATAVYVFIKLNISPQQRLTRTFPDLPTAVGELLTRQQPAPADHPYRIPDPGRAGV